MLKAETQEYVYDYDFVIIVTSKAQIIWNEYISLLDLFF